jgi:hypothetical protein
MPTNWTEQHHPDGGITWTLAIPPRPGLRRPTVSFNPGQPVTGCSAHGFYRQFPTADAAKAWASKVSA